MRTEQQMSDLIVQTAIEDERIRAVILNGSRANPNAPRDCFQDYDVVYLVTEVTPFVEDAHWIDRFGERMVMQEPDLMDDPAHDIHDSYAWLMQFMDGNRIDLTLFPIHRLAELEDDSQTIMLLDKDNILPVYPPASDRDYLPKPPSALEFFNCCNEFWWVAPYAAKGLWRKELPYFHEHLDLYLRAQLHKILDWYVGVRHDFSVSSGKLGKYYQRVLEPELWELAARTYADADTERCWEALLAMTDLFRLAARVVADHFGYTYPAGDDARVSAHLRHVRGLSPDAEEMYP